MSCKRLKDTEEVPIFRDSAQKSMGVCVHGSIFRALLRTTFLYSAVLHLSHPSIRDSQIENIRSSVVERL